MSHSTVLVVLKNDDVENNGLKNALAAALEKFDENKETPQYIRRTRAELIARAKADIERQRDGNYAEYLKDPEAYAAKSSNQRHVAYLRDEFPEQLARLDDEAWLYEEATKYDKDALDAEGNLLSTYNPDSKWDWYSVGGRWSGAVLNTTQTIHHPAEKRSETWTTEAWDELAGGQDFVQKKDLEVCHGTFAFLDTGGTWHERGSMGWWGMVSDEKDPDDWGTQLKALIEAVEDEDWLVVVDVHI